MTKCRRFNGEPVNRLIVSVPRVVVAKVDAQIAATRRSLCRSEFVRLAILEKLERDKRT